MKTGKEFACVEMKAEIQERLLREVAELGEEEAQRRRAERLSRDPILGSFLRTRMANSKGSAGAYAQRLNSHTGGRRFPRSGEP
jgi:hypothetical protein